MKLLRGGLFVSLLFSLTACATTAPPDPDAAEGATVPTPDEEGTATEVGLGDTHEYGDGLAISVSGFQRGVTDKGASPPEVPFVRFTVELSNGSGDPVDPAELRLACTVGSGDQLSDLVHDREAGIGEFPDSRIQPGRTTSIDQGCTIPREESLLRVEVSLADGSEPRSPVAFSGEVEVEESPFSTH